MKDRDAPSALRFLPHDLLVLDRMESFACASPRPPWVDFVLSGLCIVVVRRGLRKNGLIPVGLRGATRAERCAGMVARQHVMACITPESLIESTAWREHPRLTIIPAMRHLEQVYRVWSSCGFHWGPTGSVGFELAAHRPVAHGASDLDLRILCPNLVPVSEARGLLHLARSSETRVDVQLETPAGAVALAEYVRQPARMLLKTDQGPRLTSNPWLIQSLPEEAL